MSLSDRLIRNSMVASFILLAYPAFAEESGGLPQFDATLFPGQLFWLVISFATLYLLLAYLVMPAIHATQDLRHTTIAGELEAARLASDSAKTSVVTTERVLAEARAKAQGEINTKMADAAASAAQQQAAQEKELLRHLHRSEAEIAVAREAALHAIESTVADLSAVIVDKCLSPKKKVSS